MHGEMQIRIILHSFFNNQFIKKKSMGVRLARSDFKRDIQFYGNKQFQLNVRVCFPSAFEKYKQQLTDKQIQQPYWKKKIVFSETCVVEVPISP